MNSQEIIEVLVAHQNGKQIQIRKMGTQQGFRDGKWYDVENPRWNFEDNDFRVKPTARLWTIIVDENGNAIADHPRTLVGHPKEKVLVREVIE